MHPYLVGGIGAIDNKVERAFGINDSHTSFMANAGVGIVWPFSSWGRLVADARYRYVDNANNSLTGNRQSMNDWLFSVGLQIPFGPPPQVARAASAGGDAGTDAAAARRRRLRATSSSRPTAPSPSPSRT